MRLSKIGLCFVVFLLSIPDLVSASKTVNVYAWGGIIPRKIIQQFERETGIRVNFSTYDSNETMYAKLRASRQSIYDVILPSSYFVERMKKQGMLTKIDHSKLKNIKNIDTLFTQNEYDKNNHYSIPLIWGATGIFYNQNNVKQAPVSWKQLWDTQWKEQLLLLDDSREIFAIGLMSLGYQPNDTNPSHIRQAFEHLVALTPNIKLFASDSIQAIIIDEDAMIGSVWNGDAYKARMEAPKVRFVYPQDGFVIWVDCLAIPNHPPHPEEAYQFINFLLSPKIAAAIATIEGHAIANAAGKNLLPPSIRNDETVYPSNQVLAKGYFQRDVGEEVLVLYNQYWEQLKLIF